MPSRRRPSRLAGPATRSTAREAGLTDQHLRHRDVVRLSRDTYLPRAAAGSLAARAAAVLLTAPPGAVVSHATAAAFWGVSIPLLQPEQEPVDITVGTGSAVRARRDRAVHRRPLDDDEVTRHRGISLTTPARTWRDLAMVLPSPSLLAVTDQLLAAGATILDLRTHLDRRPHGRGCARAREVLPVADPRAESPMESVLRWLAHAAGLPRPVLQFEVRDALGRFLGRADLAWPDQLVLVEFDGDVHRERDVFVRDLRRQNQLVAEGWTVLRFTSADVVGRPEAVVAEIRRALRR